MKLKSIVCTIIVLIAMYSAITVHASNEARNIYIGDIIILEIHSQSVTEDELRQKFKQFDIVELKKQSNMYSISIRTFEPGEYTVYVGNKEIVISVVSTLTDIQRDDIFESELQLLESKFSFPWQIIFYTAASIFAISACIVAVNFIKKRNVKAESSYKQFLRRASALSEKDDNYLVYLTLYFKEYVESVFKCQIIGKTTTEIVNELSATHIADDIIPDIRKWLIECDVYKFSGMAVSDVRKRNHYDKLLEIANVIEQKNININEGAA